MLTMRPWLLASLVAFAGAGCGLFFRAPAPVATISYPSATTSSTASSSLLVLLPGRGDRAHSFADAGIIDIARKAVPRADVISVDATLGYYIHRNLSERIEADVMAPALAHDYRSIWLAGVSMGGLGAALFAQRHPREVAGILLVAPFLGDEPILAEIEAAGGLLRWRASAGADPDDYQRELWRWFAGCTRTPGSCPRILLGFGSSDRFARAHRLLAAALLPADVVEVPGGHDWDPWRTLFAALLPKTEQR